MDYESMNIDALAQYYAEIKTKIKEIETDAKIRVEDLAKVEDEICGHLSARMDGNGLQSVKTSVGLLYFTTKTQVRKTDGQALLEFCKQNNDFDLLQLTPLKSEVIAYVEKTGTVPPGVDYQRFKDLAFRKN